MKQTLREILQGQLTMRSIVPEPQTYDEKMHSVEAVIASDGGVDVFDWQELAVVREYLIMEGLQFPANGQIPLLDSHDRWSIDSLLGSARDFTQISGTMRARLFFSSTEEGVNAETKVREGHLTDLSIGYRPIDSIRIADGEKALIGSKEYTGPCKVTRTAMVREVSLTPVGADEMSKARAIRTAPELKELLIARGLDPSATFEEMIDFIKREFTNNPQRKESPMLTPEELAAQKKAEEERKAAELKALEEARAKAETEARERVESILATAEKFRADVSDMETLKDQAFKEKWSAERFYRETLDRIAKPKPANPPSAPASPSVGLREFVRPWQRRAVKLLNAKVYEARGNEEMARHWYKKLEEDVKAMTDVQRNAEDVEAWERISKSGLAPDQQYRLASTLSTGAGLALVPTPLLAEIFILIEKWGTARRYFRSVPMSAATLKLDNLVTEAVAYWTTQGANITASDLVFGQGELSVGKIAGISAWTSELDEDQAIAWLPIFSESIARAIRKKEDLAGFIGDGTATYGSFTGLLNASTNIVTMDAGKTGFSDAGADDYKALRDAVNIDFREGAMYFLSPGEVSNLEGLKDLQGRYIYREPGAGLPAMLWGYPIADSVGINALTQTSAAATKFAAFGNPRHMLMGMKRELELIVSREGVLQAGDGSISYNALQADGAIVRMTERIGFKMILTGGVAVLKTAAA
ncbi:MAG: phage major capsid protein [Bacteroidota bacterium]